MRRRTPASAMSATTGRGSSGQAPPRRLSQTAVRNQGGGGVAAPAPAGCELGIGSVMARCAGSEHPDCASGAAPGSPARKLPARPGTGRPVVGPQLVDPGLATPEPLAGEELVEV